MSEKDHRGDVDRRPLCSWNMFVRDEGGFTTPAAAVALLLVLSLLFMCVDGFRVGTRAGQIQYVADAGALAADNVVAEFVTAGQVVDAVLLSFSLLVVTVYAASVVAALIPGGQGAAGSLATFSTKVMRVRDKFASSATKGLDAAQRALPALCAVRASQVVQANAQASGQAYYGVAISCPFKGMDTDLTADEKGEKKQKKARKEIESERDSMKKKSVERRQYRQAADDAKSDAWKADCGSNDGNMRERASRLAGLSGAQNPTYATVESWRFSIGLNRAISYYRARYSQEPAESLVDEPEEIANSVARKRFYEYALSTVSRGHVEKSSTGSEVPYLKKLAHGKAEFENTVLYTERAYPLSKKGGTTTLHAYAGCPGFKGGAAGYGSVRGIDEGTYSKCEVCKFSLNSLSRVSGLTTGSATGFEKYYLDFVNAANRYREAQNEDGALRGELVSSIGKVAGDLKKLLKSLSGQRYRPEPPGRYGCICIVVAPPQEHSGLPFVKGPSSTPARIAISGATLAPVDSETNGTVVSEIAAGLVPEDCAGGGVLRSIMGSWGNMLQAYTDANGGVDKAINAVFGVVPIIGDDLASRASSSFKSAVKDVGLEPGNLKTYKPVLVNTATIAEAWNASQKRAPVAKALLQLKQAAGYYSEGSELASGLQTRNLGTILDSLEDCTGFEKALSERGLTIAKVPLGEFGGGSKTTEITVSAPEDLGDLYDAARAAVRAAAGL